MVVNSFQAPVPLYCVASTHGNGTYNWQKIGTPALEFPSTPVLFVQEVGLFKCAVVGVDGDLILDYAVICVRVEPGTTLCIYTHVQVIQAVCFASLTAARVCASHLTLW